MGCTTSSPVSSTPKESESVKNQDWTLCDKDWTECDKDDPYSPPEILLTEQHKRVIVKNWKFLSTDLTSRGSRIFLLIFSRNPFIKSLFHCANMRDEDLLRDARFINHASRFMQAVGAVVDNIDDYQDMLVPLFNDLGRRHTNFKGFKPIYFNDFQESIMQVFAEDLGWRFNAFAREAWRLVLLFILTELKRGFTQSLREKAALNNTAVDSQTFTTSSSEDMMEMDSTSNDEVQLKSNGSNDVKYEGDNGNLPYTAYKTG